MDLCGLWGGCCGTDPWMELQNTGEKTVLRDPSIKMAVETQKHSLPSWTKKHFFTQHRTPTGSTDPWNYYTLNRPPKSAESKQRKCNMTESRKREKEFLKWKRK